MGGAPTNQSFELWAGPMDLQTIHEVSFFEQGLGLGGNMGLWKSSFPEHWCAVEVLQQEFVGFSLMHTNRWWVAGSSAPAIGLLEVNPHI